LCPDLHADHSTYAQWIAIGQSSFLFSFEIKFEFKVVVQKAALVMQEQERVVNEEAEKRLKAALTAKHEPSNTVSRVSSPSVGTNDEQKLSVPEPNSTEDVVMDTDSASVCLSHICRRIDAHPFIPESLVSPIFDDIKKIAPGNAYDVIGLAFCD
jgi:THO complex subunit 2